jgi:vacuolar-type H+-ATPase subunit I/STV1
MAEEKGPTLPDKPLEKMTIKELREVALKIPEMKGVHGMNKEELIKELKDYFGLKEEKKKDITSIRELKKKTRELRAKKEELRIKGDKKMSNILRRRISRLKKKTRRLAT